MLVGPYHRSAPSLKTSKSSGDLAFERQLRSIESLTSLAMAKGASAAEIKAAMQKKQPFNRQLWLKRYQARREAEFVEKHAPSLRAIASRPRLESYDDVLRGVKALASGGTIWKSWSQPTIEPPSMPPAAAPPFRVGTAPAAAVYGAAHRQIPHRRAPSAGRSKAGGPPLPYHIARARGLALDSAPAYDSAFSQTYDARSHVGYRGPAPGQAGLIPGALGEAVTPAPAAGGGGGGPRVEQKKWASRSEMMEARKREAKSISNQAIGDDVSNQVQEEERQRLKKSSFVQAASGALNSRFSNMFKAFQYVDVDRSGTLNEKELRRALDFWNVPLDHEKLQELIRACDKDGDGEVDYKEFVDVLARDTVNPAAMGKRDMQSKEAMGESAYALLDEMIAGGPKKKHFISSINNFE